MVEFSIWFIACFISTFGFAYLYYKFANCKRMCIKSKFVFLLGVLSITLIKYYNIPIISFCYFFIFYPILFYSLEKNFFKAIMYYSILIWFLAVILDFIIMLLISIINAIFIIDISNDFYIIFPSLIVCVILIALSNIKFIKTFFAKLLNYLLNLYLYDIILLFFTIFIICIGISITINVKNLNIEILLVFISLLFFLSFVLIVLKKINDYENKIFLNYLKENNNFYIMVDEENRIFRHNLMANLLCIKSVSNKKSRLLIDDFLLKNNFNIDFANHIKQIPYGINGIINQKIHPYLEKLDIKINNKIDYDIFDFLKARRYNVFVEKMIITLDNAIESSLNSDERLLIVNLYEENEKICIEIKNSYSNEINIDNVGVVSCSTKGSKRGLGLLSLFRDREAQVKLKIINNLFISVISAKKKL